LSDSLQANRLDADNEKILHRLARVYTSLGRPQDALDTYARIPNASSTDTAPARKALTSIEVAEKQINAEDGNGNMALWSIDQAKATLGNGLPMPQKWQVLRAKANLKIGNVNSLGEVQAITQSLMRQNPNDTEAIVLAARSFYLKDEKVGGKTDYDRAEQYFRQALALDPDNSDARTWLRIMKRLDRARNDANDVFKRGRYSDAVDMYTKALEIDPQNRVTNAKLLGNRALSRIKLKEYDLAREDCDQALKLDPTYMKAKRTRAKATGEGGDWDQAVKDLKALAEENPGDNDLARELRNAELELKKSKRKDYYKILGVDKDAGDKEIERAYKKKAAIYHPDKTQGDKEKEALFKDCLEAKEILTDPQKRTMYDQGIDPNDPTSGMGGGGFPGGMGGGGMNGIDPEILMQMFGQQMGGGGMGGGRGGRGGFGGGGMPHFQFQSGGPGMGRGGGFPF
jgi:DnaJ homolog subfamily C member 7